MRTDSDGITEYLDDSMNPLDWYSAVRGGQTYYVSAIGKKMKVYDTNFHRIQRKSGFWSNMARGFASGVAAYGQALQAQATAARQADTYAQPNTSYNTTTQQIWSFGYLTPVGSRGSSYQPKTPKIGE